MEHCVEHCVVHCVVHCVALWAMFIFFFNHVSFGPLFDQVVRINEKFRLDMEARLGPLMLAREDMLKQHSAAVEELKRVMGLNQQTALEKYAKEAKQRQDLAIARQIASSQERINGIRAEEQQKREETLREAARRLDEGEALFQCFNVSPRGRWID